MSPALILDVSPQRQWIKHHKIHLRNRDLTIQWYVQCICDNDTREENRWQRKTERTRENTYQTPVMQIRIYTGDLRSIISAGLWERCPSCHSPRGMSNKSSIQKCTQSREPLRPLCYILFNERILGKLERKIGTKWTENGISSLGVRLGRF